MSKAMDRKVRFEVAFHGDDAHISARVAEVIRQMNLLGIRLEARLEQSSVYLLEQSSVYLLADHEDPVDSSTVDDLHTVGIFPPEQPRLTDRPVLADGQTCGMIVCGHQKGDHITSEPRAKAGVFDARPPGTHCTVEIAPGQKCNCPGFEPVTGTIQQSKPGPY
jgi:hypothetical protein